ncbi:semaphorin-7A-like isoform X2 [Anguilla rostrata]|uniref:semaphorin-7A-like isoform X2 n=1 Tax=Anguilla rostrata TaxID=7938 RepID=UPI0030D434BD
MFVSPCLLFLNIFSFCLASSNNPRVLLDEKGNTMYPLSGNNRRIELLLGPHNNSIFVGGHGRLWYIDFNRPDSSKEVTFPVLERKTSNSKPTTPSNYEYDITTLHSANAKLLFVCGSNGKEPKCCFMSTERLEMNCSGGIRARGIAPLNATERAPSLYLEGDVYAAVNTDVKDNLVALRRIGPKADIWPDIDKNEQRYVSMAFSGPREDQLQDRVYTFLMQKSLEASSWTTWVTQVCKADLGGSKMFLQKAWTSRLSARLLCGIHDRMLFFDQLVDVTVSQEANWEERRVYGLFKNSWDMTAVCVYTMADIDNVFKSSDVKGECVEDSTKLGSDVLRKIKDNPNVKNSVLPVKGGGPLMVSRYDYRHIRVDRVQGGGHGRIYYNVLFLSLESGSVHKVLEHAGEPFIIAELHPFSSRHYIQNMLLQPFTKRLYVSSSSEVVEVDLNGCQRYGEQCEDCVLARDPYCSWNGTHCAATAESRNTIQDVEHGNVSVCRQDKDIPERPSESDADCPTLDVPPESKYFLRCPMFSSHAQYHWLHNGVSRECQVAEGSCLLLIERMTPDLGGCYECVSVERGYRKTLARHQLESRAPGPTPSLLALVCLLPCLLLLPLLVWWAQSPFFFRCGTSQAPFSITEEPAHLPVPVQSARVTGTLNVNFESKFECNPVHSKSLI